MQGLQAAMLVFRPLLVLATAGLFVTCGEPIGPEWTDEEREEAQLIAVYLSGELTPPTWLTNRIRASLRAIRDKYGHEYEVLNEIRFRPPWVPSRLLLMVDSPTAERLAAGDHKQWDRVNRTLEVIDLEPSDDPRWFVLDFAGVKHPWRLLAYYSNFPGVLAGTPEWSGGDGPNVFPSLVSDELTFLFWDAWCPPPARLCRTNDYFYLRQNEDGLDLAGVWQRETDPFEPRWWSEAVASIRLYEDGSRSP